MYTKLLVSLGMRSACCGTKIETWHLGKDYCSNCERWLGSNQVPNKAAAVAKKRRHTGLRLRKPFA